MAADVREEGRVCIVTGAGSGMGQLAARRMLARGAVVVGLDLNEKGLASTPEGNPNFHPYVCDVTDEERVEQIVSEVEDKLGPVDLLMHAAAIMPSSKLIDHDLKGVKVLMRINYEGTVNMAYTVIRRMNARGRGEAIFFGSVAGHVVSPHFGAYSASKAAVNTFVECLIRENEHEGVKIMLVCPPQVNTPLLEQTTSKPKTLEMAKDKGMLRTPDFIIDEIEKASQKGKPFLYPGIETKIMYGTRRLAPDLLWWVIDRAESGKPLFSW